VRRPLFGDELALSRGVGDGTRERVDVARLVEPDAASAAHVGEVEEDKAAF
jgi:hypothetical protein